MGRGRGLAHPVPPPSVPRVSAINHWPSICHTHNSNGIPNPGSLDILSTLLMLPATGPRIVLLDTAQNTAELRIAAFFYSRNPQTCPKPGRNGGHRSTNSSLGLWWEEEKRKKEQPDGTMCSPIRLLPQSPSWEGPQVSVHLGPQPSTPLKDPKRALHKVIFFWGWGLGG